MSFNADSSIDVISHMHCALWVSKTLQTSKSVHDKTFCMLSHSSKVNLVTTEEGGTNKREMTYACSQI